MNLYQTENSQKTSALSSDHSILALNELIQKESAFIEPVLHEMSKMIIGQHSMIERIIIAMLCDGHILLEGVPGLAKTLTIKTLADIMQAGFSRIQFTPDLLPADVLGTMIYNQKTSEFVVKRGPIFANIVLADEINRAPAKVQSALLEAMQERQITLGDTTFLLDAPFMVLATQNPLEQEGTYPLPEAQLDRFLMKVVLTYPKKEEERLLIERHGTGETPPIQKVLTPQHILKARKIIEQIYIDNKIKNYIVDIVSATRDPSAYGMNNLKEYIACGASPRASLALYKCAKAHAFMRHRGFVTPEDIKNIGIDVLQHRIILSYEAEAEEKTTRDIILKIFENVEIP